MGSAVVIAPILVSELGAAQFGIWAVVLAAVGLFSVLGSGGDMVAARVIAELKARGFDTRKPAGIAVTLAAAEAGVLTVALIALAPIVVAACGVADPARAEAVEAMRWIAAAYVFQRMTRTAVGCLSGLGRHRARALLDVSAPLLFAFGGTAILLSGGGLIALSATYLLAAAAGAVATTYPLTRAPRGRAVDMRETARNLWRLGRPRQLSQVAFVVALLGERALISHFASEVGAGSYAAASTLVAAATMVLLYALNPLGPEFVALAAAEGPGAVRSALRKAERATALLAGACLGALAACGAPLMAAWVGPQLEAGHYIAILAPGFFLWLLARVGFHAAAALNEPWLEARTAAWAIVLIPALALLVLELFGPGAAGVATSVSLLLWAAAFARSSRALLGAPSALELFAPGIIAAAIAAPLAIGGGLLLGPAEGSRWAQAAMAVVLALSFLALYTAAMWGWRRRRAGV
jgi:O-antigen/teichoic acid export membrane protein